MIVDETVMEWKARIRKTTSMSDFRFLRLSGIVAVQLLSACGPSAESLIEVYVEPGIFLSQSQRALRAGRDSSRSLWSDAGFAAGPRSTLQAEETDFTPSVNCVGINVMGANISSAVVEEGSAAWTEYRSEVLSGDTCSYPGKVSDAVSVETGGAITVKVPFGTDRVIQLVGYAGMDCSMPLTGSALMDTSTVPGAFELGRSVTDLLSAAPEVNLEFDIDVLDQIEVNETAATTEEFVPDIRCQEVGEPGEQFVELIAAVTGSCAAGELWNGTECAPVFTVTYAGNGSSGGTVPVDSALYETGDAVTVPGNTGLLVSAGQVFSGWNTMADGSGTGYAPGSTYTMGSANVTLYAVWSPLPGSFSIGSAVAGDSSVSVTWGASANASAYTLAYGTSSGSFTTVHSTSATSPTTISGLAPGTNYYFMVTATNSDGSTQATAEASATPLGTFSISSATSTAAGSVQLAWGAAAGATAYTVKYGTTSGSYPSTASTTATSPYTVTGLTGGTTYYFTVTATNASGSVPATAEASATPLAGFSISSAAGSVSGEVQLSWGASSGATAYTVKYGTTSGAYTTTSSTNATSPYTVTGLTGGTTYYFMVLATNASGSTPATSEASATPLGSFSISHATVSAAGSVQLTWGASTGATAYTVKYGTSSGVYTTTASTTATSPYTATGLTGGTTYYFMVSATNASGSAPATAEATVTPLGSFSISSAAASGAGGVQLAWGASSGATAYTVSYGTSSGSYSTVNSTNASSPATITGLTPGTTYYFMVTATNAAGSLQATAQSSAIPLGSFSISSATVSAAGSVQLSWDASTGATAYTVKYGTGTGTFPTTVSTNATSPYTVTGLTGGTTYHFMVAATNASGSLNASASTSATALASFAISSVTPGTASAAVAWASSSGATSYDILYDTSSHTTSGTYASSSTGVTSGASISSLTGGTTYYFRVRANGADGSILSTNELSSVPTVPSTPFALTIPYDASTQSSYSISDSSRLSFAGGTIALQSVSHVDDSGLSSAFNGGTMSGTQWDSTNGYLRIDTMTHAGTLDSSWTPQWSSLKAYWKLDESFGATTATDSSGSGNTATLSGSASFGYNCKVNLGAQFNAASSSRLSVASPTGIPSGSSSYTLSAWIYPNSHSVTQGIIGFGTYAPSSQTNALRLERVSGNPALVNYWWGNDLTATLVRPLTGGWHHVAATWNGTTRALYVDGDVVASDTPSAPNVTLDNFAIGRTAPALNEYFDGYIDETAIWNVGLTAGEVKHVYERQAAKFSGVLKSRVMDGLSSGQPWTSLGFVTTLPFGKEIVGTSTGVESTSNYSGLTGNLSTGATGTWSFNGSGSVANGASLAVRDGGNATASNSNGSGLSYVTGRLGQALRFDGVDDHVSLPNSLIVSQSSGISVSLWFRTADNGVMVAYQETPVEVNSGAYVPILYVGSDNLLHGFFWPGAGGSTVTGPYNIVNDGNWHHAVFTADGTNQTLYLDGSQVGQAAGTFNHLAMIYNHIGTGNCFSYDACPASPQARFKGDIDEVSFWGRAIGSNEVLELYRRGSSAVKFQVRTCSSSDCSDQDAVSSGRGWKGPDGSANTFFSELYNTTGNAAGAAVATGSPAMTFSNFTSLSVSNNRYFQYRAILESNDANMLCSYTGGETPCSPELKSVTVGPNHYDTTALSITSSAGIGTTFQTLDNGSFYETLGAMGCSAGMRYSLSANGTNFYYYDGSAWAASSGYDTASAAATLASHLATFDEAAGSGTLRIRAWLKSDGSSTCELDELGLTGMQ